MVDGGYYVDGKTFFEVNEAEIREVALKIKSSSVHNVVISGKWASNFLLIVETYEIPSRHLLSPDPRPGRESGEHLEGDHTGHFTDALKRNRAHGPSRKGERRHFERMSQAALCPDSVGVPIGRLQSRAGRMPSVPHPERWHTRKVKLLRFHTS